MTRERYNSIVLTICAIWLTVIGGHILFATVELKTDVQKVAVCSANGATCAEIVAAVYGSNAGTQSLATATVNR